MKKFFSFIIISLLLFCNIFMTSCDEKYMITYDLQNGILPSEGVVYEYMVDDGTIVVPNPRRVGFVFLGWTYLDKTTPTQNVTFSSKVAKNITFVAHWQEFVYTVELDLDYITPCTYRRFDSSNIEPFTIKYNNTILDLAKAVPVDSESFSFKYWQHVKDDGTIVQVTSSTIFNEEVVGDNPKIVLRAICVNNYTPNV